MAWDCEIFEDCHLVWKRFSGCVTLKDIHACSDWIASHPKAAWAINGLVDLREGTEFELDFNAVMNVGASVRTGQGNVWVTRRRAVLAATEVGFGIGRMYQSVMSEVPGIEIGVFLDQDEAVDYLDLDTVALARIRKGRVEPGQSRIDPHQFRA